MFEKFFLKSSKKNEISAIFTLGTTNVYGHLVMLNCEDELGNKLNPKIYYTSKVPVHFASKPSLDSLTKTLIQSLDKCALDLVKKGLSQSIFPEIKNSKISQAHFIVYSPWIFSKLNKVFFSYKKPEKINKNFLKKTIKDEIKSFDKMFEREEDKDKYDFDLDFIENKVFDTKINGYSINLDKPVNANELEIAYVVSIMSKKLTDNIFNTIHRHIHCDIDYHSAFILEYFAMKALYTSMNDYVLFNFHGEYSDISIIKNGVPILYSSIDIGVREIDREGKKGEKEFIGKIRDQLIEITKDISIPSTALIASQQNMDLIKDLISDMKYKELENNVFNEVIPLEENIAFVHALALNNEKCYNDYQ